MAVETNTLTTSGKYSLKTNWSLGLTPTNKHFAVIPTGKTGKIEAAAVAAAAEVVGIVTSAAASLTIGGTEAQAENIALKVAAAATITGWGNATKFNSTAATRLTIDYGGKECPHNVVLEAGKYKLASVLTSGTTKLILEKSADLDTAEKTLELSVEVKETATLTFTNSTIVLAGAGIVWNAAATATLTSTGSTIEVTRTSETENTFEGGGLKYNALKLPGVNCVVNQANKFTGTVTVNNAVNKPAVGKGARFQKSVKQTLEHATIPLEFTGKAGELSRLESTEAAKPAELEWTVGTGDYEPANSFVAVKDITWPHGILYLPNGKDEGGNTNIKFEAKPAEGVTIPLAAAKSESTATAVLTAPTKIPVSAAESTSTASLAVTTPTTIPLSAASSTSTATAALTAPTTIPLNTAASTSTGLLALTAPTLIPLQAASSTSTGLAAVKTPTVIPLQAAASTSTGFCTVTTNGVYVTLQPAASASTGLAKLTAATTVPFAAAVSSSTATLALTAATRIPLQPAQSASSASCTVTVTTLVEPQTVPTRAILATNTTRAVLSYRTRAIVTANVTRIHV